MDSSMFSVIMTIVMLVMACLTPLWLLFKGDPACAQ